MCSRHGVKKPPLWHEYAAKRPAYPHATSEAYPGEQEHSTQLDASRAGGNVCPFFPRVLVLELTLSYDRMIMCVA